MHLSASMLSISAIWIEKLLWCISFSNWQAVLLAVCRRARGSCLNSGPPSESLSVFFVWSTSCYFGGLRHCSALNICNTLSFHIILHDPSLVVVKLSKDNTDAYVHLGMIKDSCPSVWHVKSMWAVCLWWYVSPSVQRMPFGRWRRGWMETKITERSCWL